MELLFAIEHDLSQVFLKSHIFLLIDDSADSWFKHALSMYVLYILKSRSEINYIGVM